MPLTYLHAKKASSDFFVDLGFKAVVVAVKAGLIFDSPWLGKTIDQDFIREIQKVGVDVCGEKGEYRTLVVDGPFFYKNIVIKKTLVIKRDSKAF